MLVPALRGFAPVHFGAVEPTAWLPLHSIQEHNSRVQSFNGGVDVPANLGFLGLSRPAKPLTGEEGLKILERDHYRCQYCGLDGMVVSKTR